MVALMRRLEPDADPLLPLDLGIMVILSLCVLSFIALVQALPTSTSGCSPPAAAELFAVAPMMGHTDAHYRFLFRQLSQRTYLYTEMVPAGQIVRAYERACRIYLPQDATVPSRMITGSTLNPDQIVELAARFRADPDREFTNEATQKSLTCLLGRGAVDDRTVLQLGGSDPDQLGMAAAVGAVVGGYRSVNLNCGCPSSAVTAVQGSGAALMRNAPHVAACIERMRECLALVGAASSTILSVKHRLGVREAATFDAAADRLQNDDEAFAECRDFVRTITRTGAVTKCHVHGRLALLGDFELSSTRKLWVPSSGNGAVTTDTMRKLPLVKVDHKRVQERARKYARQATIHNRSVPPLRPGVVRRLADEFRNVEFVANGGTESLSEVRQIMDSGLYGSQGDRVVGAMVGRAVINHPCSFADADSLWDGNAVIHSQRRHPTRRQVLQEYLVYCDMEEVRYRTLGASQAIINDLTKKLAAAPFQLFVGEDGNESFQRSTKKVLSK